MWDYFRKQIGGYQARPCCILMAALDDKISTGLAMDRVKVCQGMPHGRKRLSA
jgi:hypothetical protein